MIKNNCPTKFKMAAITQKKGKFENRAILTILSTVYCSVSFLNIIEHKCFLREKNQFDLVEDKI